MLALIESLGSCILGVSLQCYLGCWRPSQSYRHWKLQISYQAIMSPAMQTGSTNLSLYLLVFWRKLRMLLTILHPIIVTTTLKMVKLGWLVWNLETDGSIRWLIIPINTKGLIITGELIGTYSFGRSFDLNQYRGSFLPSIHDKYLETMQCMNHSSIQGGVLKQFYQAGDQLLWEKYWLGLVNKKQSTKSIY